MGSASPIASLTATLKDLGDYAETLVAIKAKGDSSGQLPAACAAGTALLLRAREQERLASLHAAALKDGNASQRSQLDHDSLQLHNLVYEQQYYAKEIAASRAFKSAFDEGQIGSAVAQQSDHQAETNRLLGELQTRQALQQQLQQLQQQREVLLRERNTIASSYAELRQQVEQCHTDNNALVQSVQPNSNNIQEEAEAAQKLPLPLYIIYTQAAAAANLVGLPVLVSVEANPDASKQQGKQQSSHAPAGAKDAKQRRRTMQQEEQAYQLDPYCVRLDLQPPAASGSGGQLAVSLTFSYYSQLQLVGVQASTAEDQELITNLFLGDVGDGLWLENVGMSSRSGTLQFAEAGRPSPFRWAQELGGVDVLASLPASLTGIGADPQQVLSALSSYRSSLRVETFVDRLLEAKRGRQALKRIFKQLASREQPACDAASRVVSKISTSITAWVHLSDVGVQQELRQEVLQLEAGGGSLAPWQPQQQISTQEEGEVAGEGGELEGVVSCLLPGDTAEEDLLQGLLEDDRLLEGDGPAPQQQQQGEAGVAVEQPQPEDDRAGDYEGLGEDEQGGVLPEASGDSAMMGVEEGAEAAGAASGSAHMLLASHSVYRLVLQAPCLEVHLHAKVFFNYPLCPPIFSVTKLLDTSSRGEATLMRNQVNLVLKLQQQANCVAVQEAAVAVPPQVLALQVLRLRQCVDVMSAQLRNQHSKDIVSTLRAKQSLTGRDRSPRLLGL